MTVPVNVNIYSDPSYSIPISGVAVGVYDQSSLAELAYGVTDVNGRMACILDPGTYECRVSKYGVRFQNPTNIIVVDGVGPNNFVGLGLLLTIPAAVDPRCCTVTGRFMGLNNQPISGATVRFSSKTALDSTKQNKPGEADEQSNTRIPISVDGNGIVSSGWTMKTDTSGFASMDLIRGANLFVTFSGEDDQLWEITVPDRASANLFDLINPYPVSLAWDQTDAPGNAVTLVAGGDGAEVHYDVFFSDFIEREDGLSSSVEIKSDNINVALVEDLDGRIVIAGRGVGTAHVTVKLKNCDHPVRFPTPVLTYTPITVTVTP